MSEATISMLVGFLVVVGLRLLDWAFPKGYVWRKIRNWSEPFDSEDKKEKS